jgi:hypothetical protein
VRNEERFIGPCLENLIGQGVQVYVCDNGSTDRTREIAERRLGAGVIAIEQLEFDGTYRWEQILQRKEAIFREVDADWVLHVDADEIHLPPVGHTSIVAALAEAAAQGHDTVEFDEFTFVPTLAAPDHDHDRFVETLRTYYPFRPRSPHCVRAYRTDVGPIEIAWSGGHMVRFDHVPRLSPVHFRMKHYLFLSHEHAVRKYAGRTYSADEVEQLGWHGWRAALRPDDVRLPTAADGVRTSVTDDDLDATNPWTQHWLDRCASR